MRINGKPASDAGALTALVAADGATGGFIKDDQADDLASGFLYGLTLSNNGTDATNDIDVAAGKCIDSTNVALMSLSALTKRLDANWAAGTNQGMRNSARAIGNATYHIFAVCKAAGADPDIYALDNQDSGGATTEAALAAAAVVALQAETGGSAYVYARRIGSILRESAAIVAFTQDGDEFLRSAISADVAVVPANTNAALGTLKVPVGIKVRAIIAVTMTDDTPAADNHLLVTSPDQTDVAAALGNCDVRISSLGGDEAIAASTNATVRTNTSAQIRYRVAANAADIGVFINTRGWFDTRGRLA